jgi:hypothetical protein
MNESSQKKENPVCMWIPTKSNSFLLETAVNNCRNWGEDVKIFILESTKELLDKELIKKINPDHYLLSPIDGLTIRKSWVSLKGILNHVISVCRSNKYPGIYVFNNTTIFSNYSGGISNIFSLFNTSAGLSGFRNGGAPCVDPSMFWISLECAESCLQYILTKPLAPEKALPDNMTLSLIAYATGHYVQILEDDVLSVYNEIEDTSVKPIVDFRNAYAVYNSKADKEKLILNKALSFN